jgi:hypothetical protein
VAVSVDALPRWLTDLRFYWVCHHDFSDGSTADSYIGHYVDEPWIGAYPGLEAVTPGLRRNEVRAFLGEPSRVATKQDPSENLFGQGERERTIRSGWVYNLSGRDGGIEVYFDAAERVVDANWGHP